MTFWDRFVFWVYLGMRDTLPAGRDGAARILNLACARGRLTPAALNDLSLLLSLACCPTDSPAWAAARQEAERRQLAARPHALWPALRRINPPPLTDLLEVGRPSESLLRTLIFRALIEGGEGEVLANLCQFLGRLYLADPAGQRPQAVRLIIQALPRYYHIPLGTVNFSCRLYASVLLSLRLDTDPLPSAFAPGPRPAWFTALHPDEQWFTCRCLDSLSEPDLMLLYLQCYARLTVGQIARVWQHANRTWTPDRIALELERCWDVIL
jgi:hypothetical protein